MIHAITAGVVAAASAASIGPVREGKQCHRPDGRPVLFTVKMGTRAADAVYSNESVGLRARLMLARIARCQRNPQATPYVRSYIRRARAAWKIRTSWQGPLVVSWYDDRGSTACGFHATYGFASLFLPCGAQIVMKGPGGTVTATMQDHGPYTSGRTFDLNPALRSALGCGGLCAVRWHR